MDAFAGVAAHGLYDPGRGGEFVDGDGLTKKDDDTGGNRETCAFEHGLGPGFVESELQAGGGTTGADLVESPAESGDVRSFVRMVVKAFDEVEDDGFGGGG